MNFSSLASLASGHVEARIVQVAVSLGVFDALVQKGQNALSLSSSLGTEPRATEMFLNALASLGLLNKEGNLFSLTEISSTCLVRGSPKYLGDMILFDSSLWSCWGDLEKAIRSGNAVRPADMYQGDPPETCQFIYAMDSLVKARGDAEVLAETLDLSNVNNILDIGPGPATYTIHLCRKNPGLRATLFDLPGTLKVTEGFVKDSGLGDRIRLETGDYRFDPIPGSYQVVFLSNIIHAESAEENNRLMRKVYQCLENKGRALIKDHILDDSLTQPPVGAIFALLMLLTTEQGRCYSFNEVKAWLQEAGFKAVKQILLPPPLTSSLVVGEKD